MTLYQQAGLYSHEKYSPENIIHQEEINELKEAKNISYDRKKSRVARPWQKFKKWVYKKKKKKVGKPTLVNNFDTMLSTVMTLMTGSAIKSAMPEGEASAAQAALLTQQGQRLSHHVYVKDRGWVKGAARSKPLVQLLARVDMSAYSALQIPPPRVTTRVSQGHHLADTGASICLGGKQFMRSLGLSEDDLTPCDMSVCGADSGNIKVLGAVLTEFAIKIQPRDLSRLFTSVRG